MNGHGLPQRVRGEEMDWTVVHNNGNSAELEAGPLGTKGRKTIKRPQTMSRTEFLDLAPGTTVDDVTLRTFFGVKESSRSYRP